VEKRSHWTRRSFVGTGVVLGTGVLFGCQLFRRKSSKNSLASVNQPVSLNSFVHISEGSEITVIVDKVEMGQGVLTLFAAAAAEEFGVPVESIRTQFAPVEEVFANKSVIVPIIAVNLEVPLPVPVQMTGLSTSTADLWNHTRNFFASAALGLKEVASKRWGVPEEQIRLEQGFLWDGGARREPIGTFVKEAKSPKGKPTFKPPI
jgi:isoquinoline 1-oxidoreductase beta subunit